jgi:OmpA-OmpF porin, OOP family
VWRWCHNLILGKRTMKLRDVLLASAMFALPLAGANAQAISGPYVGIGAGANFKQQVTGSASTATATTSGNIGSTAGPVVVLSLGWGFGNGLRAEVEGDYRQNQFHAPFGTTEQLAGGMVNVLYDFVGVVPVVTPYVGLGVGYQAAILNSYTTTIGATTLNSPRSSEGSLGYQAILGVALPIAAMPGLAVTAEYRFLGLAGNRTYPGLATTGAVTVPFSLKTTNDYNHSILLGLRYAFGAAPLPPAPMPVADMGAKTFLVFFDWDKYDLTARSEAIVRDAASYSQHTQYTRIDVDGNTDTSGTPTYNQGLSERRARTVAAELVRDGVPQSAISMHAYGDTKLLVPTGPNTREPQNRRVEIVFH